jgi:branched-chain amino acid transport system substrate-binding protein
MKHLSFNQGTCIGLALVLLVASSQSSAIAQVNGVFPDKIVVHHVGPFTNSGLAASNKEAITAANLYFSKVNAKGGVNGRSIVLATSDDNQDAKKSAELTQQVIDQRTAIAFLMPRTSPTTDAMMPLVEAAGIPLVGPQPGPDSVTNPVRRHVFAVRASYSAEVDYAIKLQHSFGRTKFAFIGAKGGFGDSVIKAGEATLAGLSLKAAGVVRVDDRNPDITEALKLFGQSKPEVIFFGCTATCGAGFIKAYNLAGNRAQYIALSNSSNTSFIKELGDQGRGVIVMQVAPSPTSPKLAISREFKAAADAAKIPLSYTAMQSWIAARIVVEGLQRAGAKPTPESLTNALESLQNFNMGDFIVNYGPKQRAGSRFIEPTMINAGGDFVY